MRDYYRPSGFEQARDKMEMDAVRPRRRRRSGFIGSLLHVLEAAIIGLRGMGAWPHAFPQRGVTLADLNDDRAGESSQRLTGLEDADLSREARAAAVDRERRRRSA